MGIMARRRVAQKLSKEQEANAAKKAAASKAPMASKPVIGGEEAPKAKVKDGLNKPAKA